jgi:DNA-binding GntR family transcriptional regulator
LKRSQACIPKRAAIDAALLRLAPAIPSHERMAVLDHAVDSRGLSVAAPETAAWLSLDDRFHESGGHGTGDWLVDSSFAVDQTRTGIMARWRHAVELAMTDEAIGKLTEISRSRTDAASRVARAQMLLRYAEKPSSACAC